MKGSLAFLDEYFQELKVFHEASVLQLTRLPKITQSTYVFFTYERHLTGLFRVAREKKKTKQNEIKRSPENLDVVTV